MTASTTFISAYETRLKRAQDVLKEGTKLSHEECRALAVRLLHTLDTVRETVR